MGPPKAPHSCPKVDPIDAVRTEPRENDFVLAATNPSGKKPRLERLLERYEFCFVVATLQRYFGGCPDVLKSVKLLRLKMERSGHCQRRTPQSASVSI